MSDQRDESLSTGTGLGEIAHLSTLAVASEREGLIWSGTSEDLNSNLLLFANGNGVDVHVNTEVDVLVICVLGEGTILIDGADSPFAAGDVVILPKGAARGFRAGNGKMAYLTCHRRRGGLWPTVPAGPRK